MESIYTSLAELLAEGQTVAMATIIEVHGSVPREVGAKMIVHPLGRHVGTVGGGCGEADVIRAALGVLESGVPTVVRVDLTEDVSMQALGVCGGVLDVYVERVSPGLGLEPVTSLQRVDALLASMRAREPVALVSMVAGPQIGKQAIIWLDRPPLGQLEVGEEDAGILSTAREALRLRQHKLIRGPDADTAVFVEVQRRSPEMLIVGGGHIAMPLAEIASSCDFAVTVLDDRPSFSNRTRFPSARQVITAPLREAVRDFPLDQDSYVVLVTRGHAQDVECLLEVLTRPVAYIGMIGSRRRVDAVFQLLENEMHISPELFDRVYAPIGLDIAALTPAEIAIAIMGEIISVFRGGSARSLSDLRRERMRARRPAQTNLERVVPGPSAA